MLIEKSCPFCSTTSQIEVNEDDYEKWASGLANILDAFPNVDAFGRELLISGICYNCQEKTFNRPLPYHAKAWGKVIGECEVCGSSIYENKDKMSDGNHKCAQCGEIYESDEGSVE